MNRKENDSSKIPYIDYSCGPVNVRKYIERIKQAKNDLEIVQVLQEVSEKAYQDGYDCGYC